MTIRDETRSKLMAAATEGVELIPSVPRARRTCGHGAGEGIGGKEGRMDAQVSVKSIDFVPWRQGRSDSCRTDAFSGRFLFPHFARGKSRRFDIRLSFDILVNLSLSFSLSLFCGSTHGVHKSF